MYDVIIIGAGVSGSASARELSRYKAKVCVLEREEDVCCGTSKANSAIAHAGFDAAEGSLMAKLNVRGNKLMADLAKELDFSFQQNGSLVVCTDPDTREDLEKLLQRGVANGVEGLRIVEREELLKMEPNISDDAVAALYAPTAGIVCPFEMNIAFAENANTNGVEFVFHADVTKISKQGDHFVIESSAGTYEAKVVVNAAGVYGDVINNMVSAHQQHIVPRRGDYFILDKTAGKHVTNTIFPLPTKKGKGILVAPTVHGNLLVGPTAIDTDDRDGINTTREGLDVLLEKCGTTVKNVPLRQVITSFAGLRAHEGHHEFIIGEAEDVPGFVNCSGIESPGLTSSPAIGEMVAEIVANILHLEKNPNFNGTRKGVFKPESLSLEERNALIKEKPAYGHIICRCESVSEGEILDAIHRPLGARSLDAVKRRTRAGTGRCQAGFCSPKTVDILCRELNLSAGEVTKCGAGSNLVTGVVKEDI